MEYLNPNTTHQIDFPVMVGSEYAVPVADGTFTYRVGGVTLQKVIPQVEASEISVELDTPSVAPGEFKLINTEVHIQTNIGTFRTRKSFGVVDLLDIPVQAADVREILGVTAEELPDTETNIESVYLDMYKVLINNFHTLRQTDDYLNKKFGELIAIIAALKAAPQLLIRLDKKRSTENGEVQRLVDARYFEDYLANLRQKYLDLQRTLEIYLEPTQTYTVTVLELGTGTQWSINR